MRLWSLWVLPLFICASLERAQAQEELPPQEPPYVQDDSEFDFSSIDEEVSASGADSDIDLEMQEALPEEEMDMLEAKEEDALGADEVQSVAEDTPVVESSNEKAEVVSEEKSQNAKGGVRYIRHPQAAKGLISITKDGAYIYRVREASDVKTTGTFRMGVIDSPRIVSADGTTDYNVMYGGPTQPIAMFDYEWKPFSGYGSLGLQVGFGLIFANGNGRFVATDPQFPDQEAKEEYTFLATPLNVGAVYRLEWLDHQWLAPFVAAGGTYVGVVEFRDDGKSPSVVGTPGVYAAGGILFNISRLDRQTAFTLYSEYEIKNLWVSLEYRQLQTFSEDLDFSSGITSLGVSVDY